MLIRVETVLVKSIWNSLYIQIGSEITKIPEYIDPVISHDLLSHHSVNMLNQEFGQLFISRCLPLNIRINFRTVRHNICISDCIRKAFHESLRQFISGLNSMHLKYNIHTDFLRHCDHQSHKYLIV